MVATTAAEAAIPLHRVDVPPAGLSVTAPVAVVDGAATVTVNYDDGEADAGLFPIPPDEVIELAMRYQTAEAGVVEQVDVCLIRQFAEDSPTADIRVRLYEAGASGPGARIATFAATLTNFPVTGLDGDFVTFTLPAGQAVPASFYVGVELAAQTSELGFCVDRDSGERPIFLSIDDGATWDDASLGGVLMVRPRVELGQSEGECDAGSDAIFLLGNRFRVDVCYRTNSGEVGTGKLSVIDGTGATLWFFNPNNPEVFVKVRNACVDPFQRYWFFAAGLTDVEVTITVTDTVGGQSETYKSSLGQAFPSVQDTNSFDTCP